MRKVLKDFLEAWKVEDYDTMHELSQKTYKVGHTKFQLEAMFRNKITSYKVKKFKKSVDVIYDAEVSIVIDGETYNKTVRMIKEIEPFSPSIDGEWGVNPVSILR